MLSTPEHGPDAEEQPSPLMASTTQNGQGAEEQPSPRDAETQTSPIIAPTPQNAQSGQDAQDVQRWVITDRNKTKVSEDHVPTRFFIISDTHNDASVTQATVGQAADVLILCGNITQDSLPSQYKRTAEMLSHVDAPLKLAIPGNYDYSLEESPPEDQSEEEVLGVGDLGLGDARDILEGYGFQLLNEGNHTFSLPNGAELNVYASSWTPYRRNAKHRRHAFQFTKHSFRNQRPTDVIITHGPPVRSLPRHLYGIEDLHLL